MSPAPPSTPPGVSGTEVPLGVYTSTTPLEQKGVPKGKRMAYICQDCGYIYDLDTPFEEQDDATYACPGTICPQLQALSFFRAKGCIHIRLSLTIRTFQIEANSSPWCVITVCTAPKTSFIPANATLDDEPYDVTKGGPANSGPDSERKSQNMN